MSTFLDALKNKATEIQPVFAETPKVESVQNVSPSVPVQSEDPLVANVKLILNKNRLDVFFNRKPSTEILEMLKERGFWYRGTDKAWYHQDNPINRAFLAHHFGAEFPESPKAQESPILVESPEPIAEQGSSEETQEYSKFKRQVNALLDRTGLDAADLMLRAIDCLYNQTFQ